MAKATTTVEPTEFKRCECGCGVIVNPKRRYQQGHDARHLGQMLRDFDSGKSAAGEELVKRGWRTANELAARAEKREAKEAAKKARAAKAAAKNKEDK